MKRWQLPVYFQLRFREIIKDVERVLGNPQQSLSITQTDQSKGKPSPNGILQFGLIISN
jgi:hypothetical protein